ncbi:AAA family ATPase [Heyndrickxia coagulans]|uniref:AAA family ATPase n=1 Tax=Heyndrickxia coagulans TaxID=1398 RepID=UPI000E540A41|nr:AAA family ATPase [Heyndrickxia coagulans]RGR96519.1 nucleoside triphosphate hydrolase [Heyndrickxia coagulans]
MKIREVHIYGFGRLVDFHMENLSDLQVIYGENEAGKSTFMAFIEAVLFGFPSRQQNGQRYEPKFSAVYGGRLVLETEKDGNITVERIKGRAAGEVSVTFANGRTGGEEALAHVLNGMNRQMFQSIYSFNLQSLQEIRKLTGDDISRYLFAAGTIGTDALLSAERELEKEMEARFKPNGRKPVLNVQLRKLQAMEKELNRLKAENGRYGEWKARLAALEAAQAEAEAELEALRGTVQQYEHLTSLWPLYAERKHVKLQLSEIGPVRFPADGIRRLDGLMSEWRASSGRLSAVKKQKQVLVEKMEGEQPDPLFVRHEGEIKKLLDDWPQYRGWQAETERLQSECEILDSQISELAGMLHLTASQVEKVPQLDLSIAAKERLSTLVRAYDRHRTRSDALQAQLEDLRARMNAVEQECALLEKELVSEEAFRDLSAKRQEKEKKSLLEADIRRGKQQLSRLKKMADEARKPPFLFFGLALLFLMAGVWSFLTGQYLFLGVFVLGAIVSGYHAFKGNRNPLEQEIRALEQELGEKEKELRNWKEGDTDWHEYERQKQLRENWKQLILKLEEGEQNGRQMQNRKQRLEAEERQLLAEISRFRQTLQLGDGFRPRQLPDAFQLLTELSGKMRERTRIEKKLAQLADSRSAFEERMEKLWSRLHVNWPLRQEGILLLQQACAEQQERKIRRQEWEKKCAELEEQVQLLESEAEATDNEIKKLFALAGAVNEEDFRKAGSLFQQYEKLSGQLEIMDLRISREDLERLETVKDVSMLEQEKQKLEEKIVEKANALRSMRKESTEIRFELDRLEKGGTFTEKLHEYYSALSEFREEAFEWARYATAKRLLSGMMKRLRETRFPQVLHKAEAYLQCLTNGSYVSLHMGGEDSRFYVKRRDDVLFAANELSQATAEQLYIALRFSLAEALGEEFPSPVVIDDGFVNFDIYRTEKMARLLDQVSESRQVLLFTCQQPMLRFFKGHGVKTLGAVHDQGMAGSGNISRIQP